MNCACFNFLSNRLCNVANRFQIKAWQLGAVSRSHEISYFAFLVVIGSNCLVSHDICFSIKMLQR